MTVEIKGFNFRDDDLPNRSLLARIDEQVLPEPVDFVSSELLYIKPRNMPTEGPQSVYLSNNHGIGWQRSSSFVSLRYHLPPQVSFVDIDKIQIPVTAEDPDIVQVDVTFVGEFFPEDEGTPFYCVWGSNTTLPDYQTIWPAEKISSQ